MKIIVCLDDRDGMLFNRRRQSRDSALVEDILQITAGSRLWMDSYSAAMFPDTVGEEHFLEKAGEQDFCFLERADISEYARRVTGVIIYRWNRVYPFEVRFPTGLFADRWRLVSRENFPGNSHEIITREVYVL